MEKQQKLIPNPFSYGREGAKILEKLSPYLLNIGIFRERMAYAKGELIDQIYYQQELFMINYSF